MHHQCERRDSVPDADDEPHRGGELPCTAARGNVPGIDRTQRFSLQRQGLRCGRDEWRYTIPTDTDGNTWYRHADAHGVTFSIRNLHPISHTDAERIAHALADAYARFKALQVSGETGL